MNAQPLQRPIGFSPSEISSLDNETVVAQHAEETAFLWTMRNRAVAEPHYSLDDLAALDERVEAHADGLRIAGDVGWQHCKANLENLGPGEVFALSLRAFGDGDRERMSEALNAGCSSPKVRPGLISALGWLGFDTVSPWVARLLRAKSPLHRHIGLAASAIHRRDPGAALVTALADPYPVVRDRALRAVGELKRHDLANHVRLLLRGEEEQSSRFWAAWALTLNRERDGVTELSRWFERPDVFGMRALQVGLRAMPLDEGRGWISALVKKGDHDRAAVIGAGVVGDPAAVPWLIKKMALPDLARLAGEAFSMITGIDLSYHDLDQDPPAVGDGDEPPIEEVLALDYESNLPWPSPPRVEQWWENNHATFAPGHRYLAGKPIVRQALVEVLRSGTQRQRAAAATELALLNPDEVLFEVRARGDWQQRMLMSWNS